MSFLDAGTRSPEVAQASAAMMEKVLGRYYREHLGLDGDPRAHLNAVLERIGGGEVPAIALGLSKEHIDALLSQARDLILAGMTAKARDKLLLALMLDPLEERALLAAAVTLQLEGRYADAGRLYAHYICMKPLDPVAYLRTGECLLGEGDADEAKEFITAALSGAEEQGDAATAGQARKLLALIDGPETVIHIRSGAAP